MKQLKNYLLLIFMIIASSYNLYSNKEADDNFLSFENLLLQEISGDVKYEEIIKRSINSITIITADDIEKKGFISFDDILNYVADFCMSSDLMWNYLGIRGLTISSSYGTRIAIAIDGNQLMDYTYSSILNSSVLEISLDFIERVELISGASSFSYGPNGMMGAINIVTKEGKDFDGGVVKASTTNNGVTSFEVTLGNKWESGLDIMFSYRGTYNRGENIYFEEYDDNIYGNIESPYYNPRAANNGIAERKDQSLGNVFYLTANYNNFKLDVMQTMSNRKYPSAGYETIFNDPEAKIDMNFINIILSYKWQTSFLEMNHNIIPSIHYSRSKSNFYYNFDEEDKEGNPIIWSQLESPIFSGLRFELTDNIEISNNSNLIAAIMFLNGFDYGEKFSQGYNYTYYDTEESILYPLKLYHTYLEYSNEITNWFSFFAGAKYEGALEGNTNSVFLPRIGAIFDIGGNSIIKGLFGTSARRPSGNDEFLSTTLEIDTLKNDTIYVNGNLKYEIAKTYELIYIYRVINFLGNFSIFYNDIINFISDVEIDTNIIKVIDISYPYVCMNAPANVRIKNYGISFSTKYKTNFGLELLVSGFYSYLNLNENADKYFNNIAEIGSFRSTLVYGVSFEVIDFLYINFLGRYETSRIALDRTVDEILELKDLPATHKINVSLVYRPFYSKASLKFLNKFYASLKFRNILNKIDYYPVSPNFGTISKVPRDSGLSLGLNLGYKF